MPAALTLSPSTLNMFRECPRCFWLNMHGKGPPPGIVSSLPQAIDLIVKDYYDRHRDRGLPPLLDGKLQLKLVDSETAAFVRSYISWTDTKTNAVLRGRMDDCFCDGETLVVMDNKTRGFPFKNDHTNDTIAKELEDIYRFQLEVYAFLLKKHGRLVADYGYLVYYIPDRDTDIGKGVVFRAEPHKVSISTGRVLPVFRNAVAVLVKSAPPAHTDGCALCDFAKGLVEG